MQEHRAWICVGGVPRLLIYSTFFVCFEIGVWGRCASTNLRKKTKLPRHSTFFHFFPSSFPSLCVSLFLVVCPSIRQCARYAIPLFFIFMFRHVIFLKCRQRLSFACRSFHVFVMPLLYLSSSKTSIALHITRSRRYLSVHLCVFHAISFSPLCEWCVLHVVAFCPTASIVLHFPCNSTITGVPPSNRSSPLKFSPKIPISTYVDTIIPPSELSILLLPTYSQVYSLFRFSPRASSTIPLSPPCSTI